MSYFMCTQTIDPFRYFIIKHYSLKCCQLEVCVRGYSKFYKAFPTNTFCTSLICNTKLAQFLHKCYSLLYLHFHISHVSKPKIPKLFFWHRQTLSNLNLHFQITLTQIFKIINNNKFYACATIIIIHESTSIWGFISNFFICLCFLIWGKVKHLIKFCYFYVLMNVHILFQKSPILVEGKLCW